MPNQLTPQQKETQAKIKKEMEELTLELSKAHGRVWQIEAQILTIQAECTHPRQYPTTIGGERTIYCPDCESSSI